MAEPTTTKLGPWPGGVNNRDSERQERFLQGQLAHALNVDIDAEGWPRRRVGRTKRLAFTDAHSLFAAGNRLLVVEAGELLDVDFQQWTYSTLGWVGEDRLSYWEEAGEIWFASASARGRVGVNSLLPWGIETPAPPQLAVGSGSLPAGKYQVAITLEYDKLESGAWPRTSTIEVPANSSIQVMPNGWDLVADTINVYLSEPNGKELYFAKDFSPAPTLTVDGLPATTSYLDLLGIFPPPHGRIVRGFKGRMFVAVGEVVYWSQPLAYHHFKLATDLQLFEAEVRMLEPAVDGFYVGLADQVLWVGGDDPSNWTPRVVSRGVVPGLKALRVPGSALPKLQFQGEVLVWATDRGFVAGLPGGQIANLTDGSVVLSPHNEATLAFREENGIRQVLLAMRDKAGQSRFAATDRAECTVIKAN